MWLLTILQYTNFGATPVLFPIFYEIALVRTKSTSNYASTLKACQLGQLKAVKSKPPKQKEKDVQLTLRVQHARDSLATDPIRLIILTRG